MRNKILIAAAAMLLAACVKDPIHETEHPDHGQITLTTDWSDIGSGITKPSSWTAAYGSVTVPVDADTYTFPDPVEPGSYTICVWNTAENIIVKGTTVAADYAAGSPGWFFTGKLDAEVKADTNHEFTVAMAQQIRQLTLVIEPTGGTTDRIETIVGTLSGVAGTYDMESGTYSPPMMTPLTFTKITEGDDAGKWTATVRLLGVAGDQQRLDVVVTFTGGIPDDMPVVSDLTTGLANFNADKKTPLTLTETFTQDMLIGDYAPLIVDDGFRQYCLQEFDTGDDGKLSHDEVQAVTRIDLSMFYGSSINHLQGIEYFSNLTYLHCSDTGLTELDLSGFDDLTSLNCSYNQLTELDLAGLGNLTYLNCSGNQLTELDLSGLGNLTNLHCDGNQLTELDLSGLGNLTYLNCSGNQLTELDLSGLGNLTNLHCSGNRLTELDLAGIGDLTYLNCSGNRLTELDLSGLGDLATLRCENNQLTKLDLPELGVLAELDCYDNQLNELNLSGLTALTIINCYNNQLDELNVSGLNTLTTLRCYGNPIAELDVSGNGALAFLYCGMGDGIHSLTVWVDSGHIIDSDYYYLNIRALRMEGTVQSFDRITARNQPVNGVTVRDL